MSTDILNDILPIFKQILPVLSAVTTLIFGLILFFFPPKKINALYGYRTPASMKSQKNWDFSQRYSGKILIIFGLILTIISSIIYVLTPENYIHDPLLSISMLVIAMICAIIITESTLKKNLEK